MQELIGNLHIHSTYSDGTGTYAAIADAAIGAGLDFIIINDHNVYVQGVNQFRQKDGKRVLLLIGEEVHDQNRMPQKNHMLVIGANHELAQHAANPQELIDEVNNVGGSSFLAHPYEFALPLFHETAITWDSWEVKGFTGLELWNAFSEFKTHVHNLPQALFYAFLPDFIPHQPLPQALARWDEILARGERVAVVAGSDSHALHYKIGPLQKVIFPYRYHFSTVNNHVLVDAPLTGEVLPDSGAIYQAIRKGSGFISNDLIASSRGFSFTAENGEEKVTMGGEMEITGGATIRVELPERADLRLIRDGEVCLHLDADRVVSTIDKPGAYRVECYRRFLGKNRGWIFSNPIYIRKRPVVRSGF